MNSADHVLGLHPSSRGLGWAFFEAHNSPFDWGTADLRDNKNTDALAKIAFLLDRYGPAVLAIEAFADQASRRAPRIRELCRTITRDARDRGMVVQVYARSAIHSAFPDTKTRHDIAAAIAARFPALSKRPPEPRKAWESERANAALFAAAACALTHFARRDRAP